MTDQELIESMGGPTKVAERLGYTKRGGVQRVSNWLRRGIPAAVKVQHPELFLDKQPRKRKGAKATAAATAGA